MRVVVLSVLFLMSCFQEQPADRMWKCSAAEPLCPEKQTCVNDWCVMEGTTTPDLGNVDLMSVGDMAKPPCTDGFPIGTQGVWACRGKFSPTTVLASALCGNGYKLCTDGNKVTDAECSSTAVKGFFFADVPAQGGNGAVAKCATAGGAGAGGMWFGCGAAIGTSVPTERVQPGFGCKNLFLVSYCDGKILFCNPPSLSLDSHRQENAANGVLCCPP